MASVVPNEGRDYMLSIFPKNGTNAATLYLGLFTGGDGTTVPAATDTLAALDAPYAEASGPASYARVAVAATDWGNPATDDVWDVVDARVVTAAQKSFAAATAAYSTPVTGFFLATASTGGVAVYYSNFDDETPIASQALGDIIRVTPKFGQG